MPCAYKHHHLEAVFEFDTGTASCRGVHRGLLTACGMPSGKLLALSIAASHTDSSNSPKPNGYPCQLPTTCPPPATLPPCLVTLSPAAQMKLHAIPHPGLQIFLRASLIPSPDTSEVTPLLLAGSSLHHETPLVNVLSCTMQTTVHCQDNVCAGMGRMDISTMGAILQKSTLPF